MNPSFFLRIRPQENRETVEKSENTRPKNETFGEKLTPVILKKNARNGAITGLQPDEKRGQRKSVPFVNGGHCEYEEAFKRAWVPLGIRLNSPCWASASLKSDHAAWWWLSWFIEKSPVIGVV
jgi:hypothetical protein